MTDGSQKVLAVTDPERRPSVVLKQRQLTGTRPVLNSLFREAFDAFHFSLVGRKTDTEVLGPPVPDYLNWPEPELLAKLFLPG